MNEKNRLIKGKEILYKKFETQEYLLPESELSLESMRWIYHVKCRELALKTNFPSAFKDKKCVRIECRENETQRHIYNSECFSLPNQIVTSDTKY